MGRWWRTIGLGFLVSVVASVAFPAAGSAAPGEPKPPSACAGRAVRLQFWPRGTEGDPRPHVVVFPRAEGRRRQQDRVGYASPASPLAVVQCGKGSAFTFPVKMMLRKVRTSDPVQLV